MQFTSLLNNLVWINLSELSKDSNQTISILWSLIFKIQYWWSLNSGSLVLGPYKMIVRVSLAPDYLAKMLSYIFSQNKLLTHLVQSYDQMIDFCLSFNIPNSVTIINNTNRFLAQNWIRLHFLTRVFIFVVKYKICS